MSPRSFLLLALIVTGGLLTLVLPAPSAQNKKTPDAADQAEEDPVLELATTAYKTAEFGRENKAPEALVAAASMLRSLKSAKKTAIAEVPTDENGKPIAEKSLADKSFADEADDLFAEASLLATIMNIKGFDALIDGAKSRNTRNIVGGPRSIHRRIGPGKTEVFHVRFRCAEPCPFAFNSSRPLHLKVERTDIQHVWLDGMHHHYHHAGFPYPGGKRGQLAPVVFRVHNPHNREHAEYTLFIK